MFCLIATKVLFSYKLNNFLKICERLKDASDCTVVRDPELHEPYMYCKRDNLWCGYDDEASATLKVKIIQAIKLWMFIFRLIIFVVTICDYTSTIS